jgi:CBS domain-containing protein
MKVKELMTRDVEKISADNFLKEAASMMRSMDVGALPVCENDKLIGIITDRDIAVRAVADGLDPNQCTVRDAMSKEVCWCYEDDDLEKAAAIMERQQIRRLPVFDRHNRAVGIISLGDLATRTRNDRLSGEVLQQVSEPPAGQHIQV